MNRELVKESISQFEVAIDNLKQSLLEEDKFDELKEAHKNGKTIQIFIDSGWEDWDHCFEPTFGAGISAYRIKPEEKPKVGDIVEVVICGEKYSFITRIETISFENGIVDTVNGWHVDSCKKLTKKEVIDLLFK